MSISAIDTPSSRLKTYIYHGLATQILLVGIMLFFCFLWPSEQLIQLSGLTLCGMIPWLTIFWLNYRDRKQITKQSLIEKKWFIVIPTFLSFTYISIGSLKFLKPYTPIQIQDNLVISYEMHLAFYGFLGLIILFSVKYFSALIQDDDTGTLKSAISNQVLLLVLISIFCVDSILLNTRFQINIIDTKKILTYACWIAGIEIFFWTFLDIYRPKGNQKVILPFESRILWIIANPSEIRQILMDSLDYQLGFAASQKVRPQTVAHVLLVCVICSAVLMGFLSCFLIVESHEQAVVFHMGKLKEDIYLPGLHFKLPWPLERASIYNVHHIRKIHVGSHRQLSGKNTIFQPDTPILWTNMHGQSSEELMIVSPPQHLETTQQSQKIPSVSLIGSDIYVEYRIHDLLKYIRNHCTPDLFLELLAMRTVSKLLYQYDIDTLLGAGRGELSENIRQQIQDLSNAANLGLTIIYVGFSGVHPPQQVASAFHEGISAIQMREMQIQKAKQHRARVLSETAGNADNAKQLIDMITQLENMDAHDRLSRQQVKQQIQTQMYQAKGKVSVMIDLAKAYRWSHESREQGRAIRFSGQYAAYQASPRLYCEGNYLAALRHRLKNATKYVLMTSNKNLLLRVNDQTATIPLDHVPREIRDPDEIDYKQPGKNRRSQ